LGLEPRDVQRGGFHVTSPPIVSVVVTTARTSASTTQDPNFIPLSCSADVKEIGNFNIIYKFI
jgi:hypothetical protein